MSGGASATLVVELLTEELPPKALAKLAEAFGNVVFAQLHDDRLVSSEAKPTFFATPRRLAVSIDDVLSEAPDQEVAAVHQSLGQLHPCLPANGQQGTE